MIHEGIPELFWRRRTSKSVIPTRSSHEENMKAWILPPKVGSMVREPEVTCVVSQNVFECF